jgi:hypothetical protein
MIVFDVEASGLSKESYPIEIAWQDSCHPCSFDTFLVRPVNTWVYWDEYAEKEIHHISRASILREGISIADACDRLNTKLSGKIIYSDAIEYDQRWVLKLFNEAGIKPKFSFGSIYEIVEKESTQRFESAIEHEHVVHRALDDVRQIIRLLFPNR